MFTTNIFKSPPADCPICPRLAEFRQQNRLVYPDWFNSPVPVFCAREGIENTKLLIIGLAPGLRGANRTGRPFTADYAGDLLYETLLKYNLAQGKYQAHKDDGLELIETSIINAVRCVPPQNKPIGSEINNCRQFLAPYLNLPKLRVIITLGSIAHNSALRCLSKSINEHKFGHNKIYQISSQLTIISSYHCSRYNTNTGKLTRQMFEAIFDSYQKEIST